MNKNVENIDTLRERERERESYTLMKVGGRFCSLAKRNRKSQEQRIT